MTMLFCNNDNVTGIFIYLAFKTCFTDVKMMNLLSYYVNGSQKYYYQGTIQHKIPFNALNYLMATEELIKLVYKSLYVSPQSILTYIYPFSLP